MKTTIQGHEQVKQFLNRILSKEVCFPSSLLLEGPSGIGKRTLIEHFLLNLYCTHSQHEYCGNCHTCKHIINKSFPDILFFSPENTIKIQQIRDLKDYFHAPPVESKVKTVFLPSLENMTLNAYNSFLKMLEEPPSYLKIIATSDYPGRIPATILSRFMRIPLTFLSRNEYTRYFEGSFSNIDPGHQRLYFYLSHGSPGATLRMIQNNDVLSLRDTCLEGLKSVFCNNDPSSLYLALEQSIKTGADHCFIPLILFLIRDMVYLRCNLDETVVNTDIYDKIECLNTSASMSTLWELADAFFNNLAIQRKYFDQFLWNEFFLWKIMKIPVNQ